MPNMTIAVQNALPLERRGVGTAMLTFFRSLGGLLGVTGSGALLARSLHVHGVKAVAAVGAGVTVLPSTVAVYRHAIAGIFGAGAVLVLLALMVLLFLPEQPLRQPG
jgi:hypothetical protein